MVQWDWRKSLWFGGFHLGALVLAPLYFSWSAFALFVPLTAFILCAGHSVGIHRLLIHRSWRAPKWLERTLAYLGTLVGLGGPLGLIALHDLRDHMQNQPRCHDYFGHRRCMPLDYFWNLHCTFTGAEYVRPNPAFSDPVLRFLERTWRWQQLPVAMVLFLIGGMPWVVWGVVVRVAIGTFGHWLVGNLTHRRGEQRWQNEGSAVQGFNSLAFGALSFGEGWHNNHHTFPRSARLGLLPHEIDLGWILIECFQRAGLATEILMASENTMTDAAKKWTRRNMPVPSCSNLKGGIRGFLHDRTQGKWRRGLVDVEGEDPRRAVTRVPLQISTAGEVHGGDLLVGTVDVASRGADSLPHPREAQGAEASGPDGQCHRPGARQRSRRDRRLKSQRGC
jgi:fatty-acid desaturase